MNIPIVDAIVIGGGLGGTALAEALERRSLQTVLIEKSMNLATGASGQAGAMAKPIVYSQPTPKMRIALKGFSYLKKHIERQKRKAPSPLFIRDYGILQLAHKKNIEKRFQKWGKLNTLSSSQSKWTQTIYIPDAAGTKKVCGLSCASGGLFFPQGLWLSPKDLCKAHVAKSQVRILLAQKILTFSYSKKEKLWSVHSSKETQTIRAPYLFLACAFETKQFPGLEWLPLRKVRGQSLLLPSKMVPSSIRCPISYDGWVIPKVNAKNDCLVGSTFEEWNTNVEKDPKQNITLYNKIISRIPEWKEISPTPSNEYLEQLATRVAFRTTSPDRLPICGEIQENTKGEATPGLYVFTAFGSHGLLFAPLLSEWIASRICQEKESFLEPDLAQFVSPNRYYKKQK